MTPSIMEKILAMMTEAPGDSEAFPDARGLRQEAASLAALFDAGRRIGALETLLADAFAFLDAVHGLRGVDATWADALHEKIAGALKENR